MENTMFDFTQYKICTKCDIIKLLSSFNKRTVSKDGHRSTCKTCDAVDQKNWYNTSGKNYYKNLQSTTKCKMKTSKVDTV